MATHPVPDEVLQEAVDAHQKYGTQTAAAEALGIARETLQRRLKLAARKGIAPGHWDSGVAPGYRMGKVTIHRRADGTVIEAWERQHPDQDILDRALEAMCQSIKPVKAVKPPKKVNDKLLTLYTFTDYHLGMLAWHREGGADWDSGIAERSGIKAMQRLAASSPDSRKAILNIQGDFLHCDGLVPETPTSKHVLDADSRFGKVIDIAIRLIRTLVSLALAKHEEVVLIIAEGNHDLNSSLILRKMFKALYENEPRVEVHDSEIPYYTFSWGYTLLGFHHGHIRKNDNLPVFFAAQFREEWGNAKHTVIHTGHRHHLEIKEHSGATVIQHPTLAARDAYASRGGYIAERAMSAITYHQDFGELEQSRVTPLMLEER